MKLIETKFDKFLIKINRPERAWELRDEMRDRGEANQEFPNVLATESIANRDF